MLTTVQQRLLTSRGKGMTKEQWKPIETAPLDGTEILIMDMGYNLWTGSFTRYHWEEENRSMWYITDGNRIWETDQYEPMLWMELPERPYHVIGPNGLQEIVR